MPETVFCPLCLYGEVWRNCGHCGGNGTDPADPFAECRVCEGGGEVLDPNPCALCGGEGQVSRVLASLASTDRRIRKQDPEWDGECRSRPGVTQFSLASYYRKRESLRGRVVGARGIATDGGDHRVCLLDAHDEQLATFYGFCWGYGGEGPHGLMDILQDALPVLFPTYNDARAFVVGCPMERDWEVTAAVAGGRS